MPGRGRGNWEMRGGKAVVVTPAVEEKVTEVPKRRLERELQRTERRKAAAEQQLADAQAEVDDLTAHEAELKALIDQVE